MVALRHETVYLSTQSYALPEDGAMNEKIQSDPLICHGKPVIRGTRVLVSTILGALAGGDTIPELLEDYPNISEEDVRAALEFAGALSRFEETPYETVS